MKFVSIIALLVIIAIVLSSNACCEESCEDMEYDPLCLIGCASCCNIIFSEVQTLAASLNPAFTYSSSHHLPYQEPYIKIPHRPPIFIS
jgi:hypothetical protein